MAYIDFDFGDDLNQITDVKEFVNSNLVTWFSIPLDEQSQFVAAIREQGNQNNINLFKLVLTILYTNNNPHGLFDIENFIGSTFLDIENHKQEILALLEVLGYGDIVNDDNITDIVKINNDVFLESTGFVLVENEGSINEGNAYAYKYSNEFGNYLLSFNVDFEHALVYYDNGGSYSPAFAFTAIEE